MKQILITGIVLLSLCACTHKEETSAPLKTVMTVTPGDTETGSAVFTGIIEEDENISLGFKTPGEIRKIHVREGSHVRAGQLLAELDADDYRLGVEALQIQYEQVRQEVERARKLYEKKSMSANDYEKAVAGLKQLGVQLQVNKNKLAYTRLYAPSSGIIESVNFSKGEMVDAGTAVFNLLHTGAMEVVCDIPADVYARKDSFTGFTGYLSGDRENAIPLVMTSIIPKADGNQLYRMRLSVAGGERRRLTPGMNVEVVMSERGGDTAISVPASSVFRQGKDTFVWVVKADSTVTRRKIVTEESLEGNSIGVLSGISPSDIVVRAGVTKLHEGEKVRILDKPSETNVGGLL